MKKPVVYLLHFERPISDRHTCQHYIGYAENLEARVGHHQNGTSGVRLLQVAKERGIKFVVARTWENGTKSMERQLKDKHCAPRMCPVCQEKHLKILDF